VLSKAVRRDAFRALLIELAIPEINDASKLSNYLESNLGTMSKISESL
jgi:hypothetical protein